MYMYVYISPYISLFNLSYICGQNKINITATKIHLQLSKKRYNIKFN